jgi:hypothetical protein
MYIDMYAPGGKPNWKFDSPVDVPMLKLFERNLRQATSSVQKYVWFWTECGRWIDWSDEIMNDRERLHRGAKRLWSDAIPGGLFNTLKAVKDPTGFLLPKLDEAIADGRLRNMMEGKNYGT